MPFAVMKAPNEIPGIADAICASVVRTGNINGAEGAANVEEGMNVPFAVRERPNDVPVVVNAICTAGRLAGNMNDAEGAIDIEETAIGDRARSEPS
jgi:hypothetical protein